MKTENLTESDYRRLRRSFEVFCQRFLPLERLTKDQQPLAMLANLEQTAPKRAEKLLLSWIGDVVQTTYSLKQEEYDGFNAELLKNSAMSIAEMQMRYSKKYAAVLKRGQIKAMDEYYMMKSVVADGLLPISDDERQKVDAIIDAFELKHGK